MTGNLKGSQLLLQAHNCLCLPLASTDGVRLGWHYPQVSAPTPQHCFRLGYIRGAHLIQNALRTGFGGKGAKGDIPEPGSVGD